MTFSLANELCISVFIVLEIWTIVNDAKVKIRFIDDPKI